MVKFLSNHKDTDTLAALLDEPVELIPHPYIEPEWDTETVALKCASVIEAATTADTLVANGDYTLVSLIVIDRHEAGKQTGFIAMKKLNEPSASSEKDAEGNIVHRNVLKPIGVRWV